MLKSCDVDTLRPGMKVGRDVKDFSGKIILKKNTVLDAKKINSLIGQSVFSVYIDFPDEPEPVKVEGTNNLINYEYLECYQTTYDAVQKLYYKAERGGGVDLASFDAIVTPHNLNELCDESLAVSQIHNMTRDGDYTIHHATNVGILAGLFAKWIKYPMANVRELFMAGILTEIGKTKVPKVILNKTGKLDDEELATVRRHVDYGYDILKVSEIKSFPNVLMGVLHHHERNDGTGYPNHLRDKQISDYGKILSFLDIYDAMAANRSYAKRNSPFDIFRVLDKDISAGKLDSRFGILFMKHMRQSFVGCWVGLSDGSRAKILLLDKNNVTSQPIVQTSGGKFFDLNKTPDLKVEVLLTAQEV